MPGTHRSPPQKLPDFASSVVGLAPGGWHLNTSPKHVSQARLPGTSPKHPNRSTGNTKVPEDACPPTSLITARRTGRPTPLRIAISRMHAWPLYPFPCPLPMHVSHTPHGPPFARPPWPHRSTRRCSRRSACAPNGNANSSWRALGSRVRSVPLGGDGRWAES
eukprot:366514-Chlamydomonas_euryale.AAC.2